MAISLNKLLFTSKLVVILAVLIFVNQSYASHSRTHIHQCVHDAQRNYFVSLTKERTKLVRRLRDCRQNITTIDNHLRCLNRSNRQYKQAINNISRRYRTTRSLCSGLRIQIRKDTLIYKPPQLRR